MSFDLKIVNGDFVLDSGDLRTVVDSEKLIQDLLKICITPVGSNPTAPYYGSYITRSLIGNVDDISESIAQSQLMSSIQILKQLQEAQVRSLQSVSPDEQINFIKDILINRNEVDPRLFSVQVSVFSKGLKPVTTAFRSSTI